MYNKKKTQQRQQKQSVKRERTINKNKLRNGSAAGPKAPEGDHDYAAVKQLAQKSVVSISSSSSNSCSLVRSSIQYASPVFSDELYCSADREPTSDWLTHFSTHFFSFWVGERRGKTKPLPRGSRFHGGPNLVSRGVDPWSCKRERR